ncbi:MAG: GAF domain-containing protein [Deltaproteobacteria bacterium]|nr:GAF domain-containing protein [Deltaproteobacteria bacterium]
MDITLILLLSLILQFTAAVLAARLVLVTRRHPAWLLLAAAIGLMGLRRGVTLYETLVGGLHTPLDITAELVGLAISVLMVVGIAWISPLFKSLISAEEARRLNESRLQALWRLSQMTEASIQEITDFTLNEAVSLTKSKLGYLGFLNPDESVLTIYSWSRKVMEQCMVADKPIHYPLAKAGLWGEAVRQRRPCITNDYAASPWKKGYPEGHVEIRRHLNLPVFDGDRIVALVGVANKDTPYDDSDVHQLTLLLNGMWGLMQRKKAEEALAAALERGQQIQTRLVDTCMDAIIANDRKGTIFIFNENAARMLGYSPEEVIGKLNVRELYPEGVAQEIKRKIKDPNFTGAGLLENYETVVRHKDGTLIPIWLSARVLYEHDREVGVIGHFRDLRERKKMEEELLRHDRLVMLGKMAAHIGHEIKNPLMIIGGFARQIRQKLEEEPQKNREKLDIIIGEIKRLEDFLAQVGTYAKFSEPQKVAGDLNVLVQETCRLLKPSLRENRISLTLNLDPDLPQALFDPAHIRQVLLNIIKNSVEAMEAGGSLTITSRRREEGVWVQIEDTGGGIPPEAMEKLFQPFFSTKPKGSGLGLAISKKIMDAHGGELTVESRLHHGTTVTLLFKDFPTKSQEQ